MSIDDPFVAGLPQLWTAFGSCGASECGCVSDTCAVEHAVTDGMAGAFAPILDGVHISDEIELDAGTIDMPEDDYSQDYDEYESLDSVSE
jgi:hypothetical protein